MAEEELPGERRERRRRAGGGPAPRADPRPRCGGVGDRLYRQLQPIADDLEGEAVAGSGHFVPLDRPDVVAARVRQSVRVG
ncbi:hypothetical protein [Pseudonocardia adelaidensis]|uniref:Alpha/beta hydrolase family protein n=1 Tax=Pseudonocardia adelaidensis TaxID=648754 RepID=A0ABP9P856_9PSEU